MDFFDLSYLSSGSAIQRRGYKLLLDKGVMEILEIYDPVLAGTLPLDLFVNGSDLDILGCTTELDTAEKHLTNLFRGSNFIAQQVTVRGVPTLIANFNLDGFPIEIFLQTVPTRQQAGYIHMINEHKILNERGPLFRDQVLALKKSGIKTEPAFAQLLGLSGDPYEAMLQPF
ncbi:MAG TPA: DUF4269 domain-containing protein [Cyclobacteriaceae bacterium]|nr:DUF4269 domain-containing protein [Cyclobacteriaceae bacterium]